MAAGGAGGVHAAVGRVLPAGGAEPSGVVGLVGTNAGAGAGDERSDSTSCESDDRRTFVSSSFSRTMRISPVRPSMISF